MVLNVKGMVTPWGEAPDLGGGHFEGGSITGGGGIEKLKNLKKLSGEAFLKGLSRGECS